MEAIINVSRRGADRIRAGHLWIYRSDLRDVGGVPGGCVVRVFDPRHHLVGQALYSDRSQISIRMLTRGDEPIDEGWWRRRISQAAARRSSIRAHSNAMRLVHAEGDLLPSLIVDQYADVLVLQTLSQATDALKATLTKVLVDLFSPACVIERNDVKVRVLEGLEPVSGVLFGEAPDELEINLNGIRFRVSPLAGQKTGSFLDQRENYLAASRVAAGRGLDCFTFAGGFALHLAAGCDTVLGLDASEGAVALARRNADLNGADNVEFLQANAFDALRELESKGEAFDTVVLDPPAFAKNRASLPAAVRGYKEINLRALKLLRPGGHLVTCTCSFHMDEPRFLRVLSEAARDAGRDLQLIEKRMQSTDHPVLLGVPETHYLKCLILRVID